MLRIHRICRGRSRACGPAGSPGESACTRRGGHWVNPPRRAPSRAPIGMPVRQCRRRRARAHPVGLRWTRSSGRRSAPTDGWPPPRAGATGATGGSRDARRSAARRLFSGSCVVRGSGNWRSRVADLTQRKGLGGGATSALSGVRVLVVVAVRSAALGGPGAETARQFRRRSATRVRPRLRIAVAGTAAPSTATGMDSRARRSTSLATACPIPIIGHLYERHRGRETSCEVARQRSGDRTAHTVVLHIDRTAPSVRPVLDRPPDHAGWFNHPVRVSFSGSDATSGIASCSSATYSGPDRPEPPSAAVAVTWPATSGRCRRQSTTTPPRPHRRRPRPGRATSGSPSAGRAQPALQAEVVRFRGRHPRGGGLPGARHQVRRQAAAQRAPLPLPGHPDRPGGQPGFEPTRGRRPPPPSC